MQFEEQCRDRLRGLRIEVAGRLIAQHQTRLPNQGASDRHPLLLTSRQLSGTMIDSRRQADAIDEHPGTREIAVAIAAAGNQRRHEHVLEHGALRQQTVILKDEADFTVAEVRDGRRPERERILPVRA